MICPKCNQPKSVSNTETYTHNFDQGTLTDEYYSDAVCMACGAFYRVKLVYYSSKQTITETET